MRRALLAVLLVAACSSSSDDPRAAYLREAEGVCRAAVEAQAAEPTPADPTALAAYVRRLVTVQGDAAAELAALRPPEADEAELDAKVVRPLQEQVQRSRDYADRVEKAPDTAAVLDLLGQAPSRTDADLGWMRDYGFRACVELVDPAG